MAAPIFLIGFLIFIILLAISVHYTTLYRQVQEQFIAGGGIVPQGGARAPPKPTPPPSPAPPPPLPPPTTALVKASQQAEAIVEKTAADDSLYIRDYERKEPCAVYYTPYKRECDMGLFSADSSVIKTMYRKDKKAYDIIMNERKNLPEPGICKINLKNWSIGYNAPIMNAKDQTNANRGKFSSWAHCFQEVEGPADLNRLTSSLKNTKSISISNSLFDNVYSSFNKKYARISFNNFDFASIKSDVCKNLTSTKYDSTIPDNLFGITLDSDLVIKKTGIYNYSNNIMVEVKRTPGFIVDNIYGRLFEERLVPSAKGGKDTYDLVLQPKRTNVDVYVFDKDVCGTNNFTGRVAGYMNMTDFDVKPIVINSGAKKEAYDYGTVAQLKDKTVKLQAKISDIEEQNKKRQTNWNCFDNILVPIRRNDKGDIECISTDGANCKWQRDSTSCKQLVDDPPAPSELRPLTCGPAYKELYGSTGYDNPKHWCAVGKKTINTLQDTAAMKKELADINAKINHINTFMQSKVLSSIESIVYMRLPYREGEQLDKVGGGTGLLPSLKSYDNRIYVHIL